MFHEQFIRDVLQRKIPKSFRYFERPRIEHFSFRFSNICANCVRPGTNNNCFFRETVIPTPNQHRPRLSLQPRFRNSEFPSTIIHVDRIRRVISFPLQIKSSSHYFIIERIKLSLLRTPIHSSVQGSFGFNGLEASNEHTLYNASLSMF